ncbi:hypothetical protein ALQ60_200235 [Pseudomonas syringae pv. papulans]|nr:hypothetical protein ALQ60_200235 [Pseudomonas syringae pv. papulans]
MCLVMPLQTVGKPLASLSAYTTFWPLPSQVPRKAVNVPLQSSSKPAVILTRRLMP